MPATARRVHPVGLALAVAGAAAMIVSLFLPFAKTTAVPLGGISGNTLIQFNAGIAARYIAFAVAILLVSYRYYRTGEAKWGVALLGLVTVVMALIDGNNSDNFALQRTNLLGETNDVSGSADIALYVAGVGGALAFIGGYVMRREVVPAHVAESSASPVDSVDGTTSEETKVCPECAETVKAAARKCRFCGYEFFQVPAAEQS